MTVGALYVVGATDGAILGLHGVGKAEGRKCRKAKAADDIARRAVKAVTPSAVPTQS
jgi:hypothetical protein